MGMSGPEHDQHTVIWQSVEAMKVLARALSLISTVADLTHTTNENCTRKTGSVCNSSVILAI